MKKEEFKSVGEILENLSPSEMKDLKKKADEALEKSKREGIPLYQALEIPNDLMDFTYNEAYRFYKNGLFEKAQKYFEFLFYLDQKNPNYMLGIAACLQMRKYYASAIRVYDLLSFLIPESPMPHFYIYECSMQLNNYDDAKLALENVIRLAESNPQGSFDAVMQKAKLMLEQHNNFETPAKDGSKEETGQVAAEEKQ